MADDIRIKSGDVEYDDDVEEIDEFEYSGYQVVRREFYAHIHDPAVSFRIDSITFNTACINKLESLYIQILVNPETKKMIIKECDEDAKDAIKWCRVQKSTGKKVPRRILCRMAALMFYDKFKWEPKYKYKIQGNRAKYQNTVVISFDLKNTETYAPISVDENGNKSKSTPFYPEDWKNSFGLPVNEHSESMVLNMLEGYQRLEYSQRRNVKLKKEGHASIFDLNGGDRNGGQ